LSKPRIVKYELPGDWIVLVGATDSDNDYLSTTIAKPEDWWFHAQGVPGSHVILCAKPTEEPSRETLRQAAAVAAYHSKSRAAGTARVHCTHARYVTKPRGSKTGTVRVSEGTVLKVYPGIDFATRITADTKPPGRP
jgi:predicted ribosome quality control (RQC) complex YloA/Tae2 family protein